MGMIIIHTQCKLCTKYGVIFHDELAISVLSVINIK